jgi:hypothetical protein
MVRILATAFERVNKGFKIRIETPLINYADRNSSSMDIRTCLTAAVVG